MIVCEASQDCVKMHIFRVSIWLSISMFFEMTTYHTENYGLKPWLLLQIQLLVHPGRQQQVMTQALGPLPPTWETWTVF